MNVFRIFLLSILCFSRIIPVHGEYTALTEDQLLHFGQQIESSLNSQNPYFFNLSFDTDRLLLHVFERYGQSPDASFHKGFVDGITQNLDLGSLLVNDLNSGGNIELVAVNNGQQASIIFRMIGLNGINYHEYYVEKVEGKLKITDAYIYSSGQRISESVGELYVNSWFNITTEYTETIEQIKNLHLQGKDNKAFRKWEQLSFNAKTEKSNLLTGLEIASKTDRDAFFEVYNLFTLYYPDEPGKYLIPLDGLIASGLYERALACIDSLDQVVMHDPILNFVRANIYYEAGKVENAENALGILIETMPDFELGYFSLLDIYLQEDNYARATLLLDQMVYVFQNYKEDYAPLFANYPDFVNSPEYQEWLQQ